MTSLTPKQLADQLHQAYRDQSTLLKSVFIDNMDVEQAYSIQHQVTAKKIAAGEALAAYKISMTSARTMALFDADEPMYGQLSDRQLLKNNSHLSLADDVNDALVELELAFVVQEPIAATDSIDTICDKCLIAPALEVPDCRYQDWFANMSKEHLCADSAVAGYLILGDSICMSANEIAEEVGTLYHNNEQLLVEPAQVVLAHPAKAVQWLVQKLESHNLSLQAGMVVSSGSFGMPVPLTSGHYVGQFQKAGRVQLQVESQPKSA